MKFKDLFDEKTGFVKKEYRYKIKSSNKTDDRIIDLDKVHDIIEDDFHINECALSIIYLSGPNAYIYGLKNFNNNKHPEVKCQIIKFLKENEPIIDFYFNLYNSLPNEYKLKLEIN